MRSLGLGGAHGLNNGLGGGDPARAAAAFDDPDGLGEFMMEEFGTGEDAAASDCAVVGCKRKREGCGCVLHLCIGCLAHAHAAIGAEASHYTRSN